ncbi:hypothetical protein C8F04DRAFT_1179555 [Mycena alexandri]|uniref:Uncharacterized protein n=1 Tax=Mycena alexandri TaxID=1745969 RepID=A0AAD6T3I4_9AGAR|nr:hypothetical protein C8F04DRAFT_1179555 [Mycena alexandri]
MDGNCGIVSAIEKSSKCQLRRVAEPGIKYVYDDDYDKPVAREELKKKRAKPPCGAVKRRKTRKIAQKLFLALFFWKLKPVAREELKKKRAKPPFGAVKRRKTRKIAQKLFLALFFWKLKPVAREELKKKRAKPPCGAVNQTPSENRKVNQREFWTFRGAGHGRVTRDLQWSSPKKEKRHYIFFLNAGTPLGHGANHISGFAHRWPYLLNCCPGKLLALGFGFPDLVYTRNGRDIPGSHNGTPLTPDPKTSSAGIDGKFSSPLNAPAVACTLYEHGLIHATSYLNSSGNELLAPPRTRRLCHAGRRTIDAEQAQAQTADAVRITTAGPSSSNGDPAPPLYMHLVHHHIEEEGRRDDRLARVGWGWASIPHRRTPLAATMPSGSSAPPPLFAPQLPLSLPTPSHPPKEG